jgi:hypothetical protein
LPATIKAFYISIQNQLKNKNTSTMKVLKLALAICASVPITISAKAQTADEIVDKYITAIGGADNWKKVNSVTSEGNLTVQGADVAVTM